MKRLFYIVFIACCIIPSTLLADYVDDKLPDDTSVQIKNGARQIIQLGVKRRYVVKITKRMLDNNFQESQILSAYDVLIQAKKQNLSEDPIIDKLNEGIAKEVQPERIVSAMEKVRVRYKTANDYAKILSENDRHTEAMTTEIAECMAAGIDTDDVGKVVAVLRLKSIDMSRLSAQALNKRSFRTLKTMARSGVESQDAFSVVDAAFVQGFDAKEMEGLENSFKSNARWTSSVSDLAKAYAAAIKDGATFDDADFYDPWTTSFGSTMPGGIGPGMPGGGIPPGGPVGGPVGGPPSGTPSGSPPSGGGAPSGPPPGGPRGN